MIEFRVDRNSYLKKRTRNKKTKLNVFFCFLFVFFLATQGGSSTTPSTSASSSSDQLHVADHGESEVKISVKERTQRFNKMASEVDLQRGNNHASAHRRDKPKVTSRLVFSLPFVGYPVLPSFHLVYRESTVFVLISTSRLFNRKLRVRLKKRQNRSVLVEVQRRNPKRPQKKTDNSSNSSDSC